MGAQQRLWTTKLLFWQPLKGYYHTERVYFCKFSEMVAVEKQNPLLVQFFKFSEGPLLLVLKSISVIRLCALLSLSPRLPRALRLPSVASAQALNWSRVTSYASLPYSTTWESQSLYFPSACKKNLTWMQEVTLFLDISHVCGWQGFLRCLYTGPHHHHSKTTISQILLMHQHTWLQFLKHPECECIFFLPSDAWLTIMKTRERRFVGFTLKSFSLFFFCKWFRKKTA